MSNIRPFVPHNAPFHQKQYLPMQAPRAIIGRDRELAGMHAALKARKAILITGDSGIGKTTIAAMLATAQLAGNPDGVLWLEQTEEDARLIIAQIGRAFGIDTYTDDADADREAVQNIFRTKKPLLVLDGLVDTAAAAEILRDVAVDVPAIIVDEPNAEGPWTTFALKPLNISDSAALIRFYGGVRDAATTPDIDVLAQRLDGHPMALELAGRQIAGGLAASELLADLPTDSTENSTNALLDLSFKRLNPPPQQMWLSLAALPTGAGSVELASLVAEEDPAEVVAQVRKLFGYGILNDSMRYGQPYFMLQRPAWRYARQHTERQGQASEQIDRGLLALLVFADKHANGSVEGHDRLAAELNNFLWGAAEAANRNDRDIVDEVIRYIRDEAGTFIQDRLFQPELEQLEMLAELESPTDRPDQQNDQPTDLDESTQPTDAIMDSLDDLIPDLDVTPPPDPLSLLTPIKPMPPMMRRPDLPFDPVTPTPPIIEPITPSQPDPIPTLPPSVPPTTPDPTPTIPPVQPPTIPDPAPQPTFPPDLPPDLPTSPDLPGTDTPTIPEPQPINQRGEALMLKTLGDQAMERGDLQTAQTYYNEAMQISDATNDPALEIVMLESLSMLAGQNKDYKAQVDYAGRGINAANQIGDKVAMGRFQIQLGDAHAARRENIIARDAYTSGIQSLGGAQEWETLGGAMYKLAGVFLELDKPDEALQVLEPAFSIFEKEEMKLEKARALIYSGSAYAKKRQWERAESDFQTSSETVKALDSKADEQRCYAAIARMRNLRGDLAGTLENYRKALHLAYQVSDTSAQAEYVYQIADLLIDDVRTLHQATRLLREQAAATPTPDLQRLLKRADMRLTRAGSTVPPTLSSVEYAGGAY